MVTDRRIIRGKSGMEVVMIGDDFTPNPEASDRYERERAKEEAPRLIELLQEASDD